MQVRVVDIGNGEWACFIEKQYAKNNRNPLWVTMRARVFKSEEKAKVWGAKFGAKEKDHDISRV